MHHVRALREVDVVLAFLPEAWMGTAIEMWHAFHQGKAVVTISPLAHNWAVQFLSQPGIAMWRLLKRQIGSGQLAARLAEIAGQ